MLSEIKSPWRKYWVRLNLLEQILSEIKTFWKKYWVISKHIGGNIEWDKIFWSMNWVILKPFGGNIEWDWIFWSKYWVILYPPRSLERLPGRVGGSPQAGHHITHSWERWRAWGGEQQRLLTNWTWSPTAHFSRPNLPRNQIISGYWQMGTTKLGPKAQQSSSNILYSGPFQKMCFGTFFETYSGFMEHSRGDWSHRPNHGQDPKESHSQVRKFSTAFAAVFE